MKAMVLAAGLGLRMRPLTTLRAKPALPVLNRPLLCWTLERLARHGVTDVAINLHHLPRSITKAVGDGGAFGLRVRFSRERRILGTGGGPRRLRDFLGDEPVLLVNGDVFFDFDLAGLVAKHRASGCAATLALKPNPDRGAYSAVVTGRSGRILSIHGLPRAARGPVSLFTGVHVIEPALLDRLPPGPSDSVRDLYVPLIAEGAPLLGVRVRGAWYDLGSPRLYLAAQASLLAAGFGGPRGSLVDGSARIGPGARVGRSVIGPGSHVGAGASVVESVLWDGVVVGARATVRRSILASGVRVAAGRAVVERVGVQSERGRRWSKLAS
jgi:NDP-sugar pyrophosphorylase family protein